MNRARPFGEDAPTLEIPRQTMAELIEEGKRMEEARRMAEGTCELSIPPDDED
jgi:hypothetical protein